MTMTTAADIYKLTARIERVAKQPSLDMPSREVIRSGVKQLLACDSAIAGQFVASLLHLSHGRPAAEAAYASVERGIFIGDDVPNSPVAHFCLVHGELKSLRPIVEMGPPPVAPEGVQEKTVAEWLVYLCRARLHRKERDLLPFWEGIASTAVATPLLRAQVDAALQLSWDVDPCHVEVRELASQPGAPGAIPREFIMRQRITNAATVEEPSAVPAVRRRVRLA